MVPVRIERVFKRFGAVTALHDVSVSVTAGEMFFLLGPSGCGKTTLLRCVAGFASPDAGRIFFGDRDITDLPAHRRNTGMVFQNYALWPHMSVEQNVAFGLEVRKVSRRERADRVAHALETVRMADLAKRKPNELSGGQQQRVALARALVVEPQCLLLDEPLSNLDAKLRLEMRGEIRRICKEAGLTAVYVTHDQKEALSIADRIAVMRDGRIEQVGTPGDLYHRPANRFVAGFVGETNFIDATVTMAGENALTLQSSIGPLKAAGCAGVAAGSQVLCSIRPEAIHLGAAPPGAPNAGRGVLEHTAYLGEMAQHEFRVGGVVLKVFELNPRDGVSSDEGVPFWIDERDVVVAEAVR
jgi:iron(III) transport system ATP-binding protein